MFTNYLNDLFITRFYWVKNEINVVYLHKLLEIGTLGDDDLMINEEISNIMAFH